jgi:hypothetical protein
MSVTGLCHYAGGEKPLRNMLPDGADMREDTESDRQEQVAENPFEELERDYVIVGPDESLW